MKNNKTINLGKGINLTLIPEEKFKSNLVSIYIQRILDRDEVTMNALLPSIIKSGSEKYPSAREMSYHQDDLYIQNFSFYINYISFIIFENTYFYFNYSFLL